MPTVVVTRLRLRSRRFLPQFACYAWASVQQARRSPGFLKGQLFRGSDRPLVCDLLYGRHPSYWTMTMWEDREAVLGFRDRGPHRDVMSKSPKWVQEASVVNWRQQEERLPSPREARKRMLQDGRLMSSDNPSEAHASGQIPEDPAVRGQTLLTPLSGDE